MDSSSLTHEMQALLAHSHWVQELARRLVRDPNVAEDLAQETLLAALEDGATAHRSAKAWLGTVLRNLVWERVRREDRRGARERDAAREEATPSTVDLMDRMSAHKQLVEVLMTLPESYREVLLRRYFEGETPNEIARSLDLPHSTVRTRLSRATAMMRERLDDEHGGDGRAWVIALLPLTSAPLRAAELVRASSSASLLALPYLLAAGVLLVGLGWWISAVTEPASVAPVELGVVATPSSAPQAVELAQREPAQRAASEPASRVSSSSTSTARATLAPDTSLLRGRVVDTEGAAQAGVILRFERYTELPTTNAIREGEGEPLSISGAEGGFSLRGAPSRGWVVAERADLVTVLAGVPTTAGARDALVVVTAPRRRYAGRVLDELGTPIGGAALAIRLPEGFGSRLDHALDASTPVPFETLTAEDGRFLFESAPGLEGSRLVLEAAGFDPLELELPSFDDVSLELTLARTGSDATALLGMVVNARGRPVANARVTDGELQTRTDERGEFRLPRGATSPTSLMALSPGALPGSATAQRSTDDERLEWPGLVVLELGPPSLAIHGRLVGTDGRGLRGVRVWGADPTLFAAPHEEVDRGTTIRVGVVPLRERKLPVLVEGVLGASTAVRAETWPYVLTDDDGQFVLEGLLEREYSLDFLDARTLMHMRSEPIEAGREDVTIEWSPALMRPLVRGRVVSTQGEPMSGLEVGALYAAFTLRDGDRELYREELLSGTVTTDAEGRFTLRDLPLGAELIVQGASLPMAVTRALGEAGEGELEVEVPAFARLVVQLTDPTGADGFSLRSAAGERVPLTLVEGPRCTELQVAPLTGGRSSLLYAPLEATVLELRLGGEVVSERPLRLFGGSLQRVSL